MSNDPQAVQNAVWGKYEAHGSWPAVGRHLAGEGENPDSVAVAAWRAYQTGSARPWLLSRLGLWQPRRRICFDIEESQRAEIDRQCAELGLTRGEWLALAIARNGGSKEGHG